MLQASGCVFSVQHFINKSDRNTTFILVRVRVAIFPLEAECLLVSALLRRFGKSIVQDYRDLVATLKLPLVDTSTSFAATESSIL